MTTISITPAQRWNGWFFSGLIAYVIQGVVWAVFGVAYAVWKEVWGGGLIEGKDGMIAQGVPVASSFVSVLGTAMLYAAIGFMMSGLVHMLAYSIPGGFFWAFTKPDSILVRRPWISWVIGWALGAIAMGFHFYGEAGWIWSATIFGGLYGLLTAAVCCALGRRIMGRAPTTTTTHPTKNQISEQGGGGQPATCPVSK
jgi:hypothetical protein